MNILIAPDKFKNSLTSLDACRAIKNGLIKASSSFNINVLPLADGGDGLSEVIQYYTHAKPHVVNVLDPLFRLIKSSLLISEDRDTAFIEMAKASGLLLLKPEEYNCMKTTSFGTGELIKKAIELGVKKIVLGVGGSATNDCGVGMAAALGFRFLNKAGKELLPIGKNLNLIESIDQATLINLRNISFKIACDVKNPLCGLNGATKVYAEQKGASADDIEHLEAGMLHFSEIITAQLDKSVKDIPGAGAAGGMGAGCLAFLNAELVSGIDLVLNLSRTEEYIVNADIVFTGEGKIDEQSLEGKVISGIGQLCKKHQKPLIAFCGNLGLSHNQLQKIYVHSAYSINQDLENSEDAYKNAERNLTDAAYRIGKKLLGPNFL